MRFKKTIAVCLLASCGTIGPAIAGPPLDRPTPPPCCAEGVCFAHSHTYGYFPTRWRTWPAAGAVPTPAPPTPAARPILDVPAYEVPPPEKEDQKALPPTTAPSEESAGETPGVPGPSGVPGPAAVPVPSTTPLELLEPREEEGNSTTPFMPTPFPPQSTNHVPPNPRGGDLLSDLDLPPVPPFATSGGPLTSFQAQRAPASARPTNRTTGPPRTKPPTRPRNVSSADPPPPPPLTTQAAIF